MSALLTGPEVLSAAFQAACRPRGLCFCLPPSPRSVPNPTKTLPAGGAPLGSAHAKRETELARHRYPASFRRTPSFRYADRAQPRSERRHSTPRRGHGQHPFGNPPGNDLGGHRGAFGLAGWKAGSAGECGATLPREPEHAVRDFYPGLTISLRTVYRTAGRSITRSLVKQRGVCPTSAPGSFWSTS